MYSRCWIVEMVGAYVESDQIPFDVNTNLIVEFYR